MNHLIKLNKAQKVQAMSIFSLAIWESSIHIRKLLDDGHKHLYTNLGTKITLVRAIARRRRCYKMFSQASRGFVL